ncbi:MAG: LptF/LptG family permease [Planctomycetaceae bacterium]
MPTRLTRYIVSEIVKIFVVALIALTMLILLIGVGRELLREGLGPLAVIQLLPYVLPVSLQYAVPATALFAVCCVYGRMSADGEVSTVKAIGVSPLRLVKPAIIGAALLSPISVGVSDLAVSWGRPGINHVVLLSIEQIAYRFLRAQHSYSSPHGFTINVQDVDGKRLIRPWVKVRQRGESSSVELTAREGSLRLDPKTQTLLLQVVDSHLEGGAGLNGIVPGETEFRIPLGKALQDKSVSEQTPSQLPYRVIGSEAIQQDRRTHQAIGHLAAHTGFSILTARWDDIAGPQGQKYERQIEHSRYRLARLQTEPWRRWAEGFSCFCFVLVGAPLSMIAKTADYWTTFGLCFLPTIVVYYPLFIFGLDQAKAGAMPPYAVWMGNAVLIVIGISLMSRVRRC